MRISATMLRNLPGFSGLEQSLPISATVSRKSGGGTLLPCPASACYENECLKGNWSVRQLQRQIGSMLFERTGLSTDKHAVIDAARMQSSEVPTVIADLIRDPYVLEFVGLAEKPNYRESRSRRGTKSGPSPD